MGEGRRIALYDTTLRDGMQMEGMSVSVTEKVRIALRLAELGIPYIEGGFPGSNPKDAEFFRQMEKEPLGPTRMTAFGTTRASGLPAEKDPVMRTLADTNVPALCIVGKTWDLHVEKVLKVDREENLRMIADSISFLRGQGYEVLYDAEHFFEAYANHPHYALQCLMAAVEGGADAVVLCDTNGAVLPQEVGDVVRSVVGQIGDTCIVGIHSHNDSGCAVANSLAAVEAGALHVQGTINGYGERCGNADLCSIIPNLQLKMGFECIPPESLARITDLSHFVAEVCNLPPDPHQPYVGRNAFAHKGGLHVSAISEDPRTFEHIEPSTVGNDPHILVSELSGKGTVRRRLQELGYGSEEQSEAAGRILEVLKSKEHQGYQYEAADASFELLLRSELGLERHFFRLESFRIIVEKREDGSVMTEATLKVHINGDRIIQTAEGNGPVNALDGALRRAIERKFPRLKDIHLVNFKVRIMEEEQGTGAVTRVLIDSSDGRDSWGSVGVSENLVEASWQALSDSIEYGLLKQDEEEGEDRGGTG